MKIVFVENRYTTRVFELVAERLAHAGHHISWIVQNHRFGPACAVNVHRVPYPKGRQLQRLPQGSKYAQLAQIDRGIRYFGGNADHYLHYEACIEQVLEIEQPDVVFGESTQFHELITVELCRARGICFLHPAATRIPHGRITFLKGDSLDPFGGENVALPAAEASAILEAVSQRRYSAFTNANSTLPASGRLGELIRKLRDRSTMTRAWLEGERYVTPSPLQKGRIERRKKSALQEVLRLSQPKLAQGEMPASYVLYPMQMQPETNLDVWGKPWHDQANIIRAAARSLAPAGHQLIVKLNPTAKYELLEPGLLAALREPNVVLAPAGMPMAPLFAAAAAVLSVTGSVIYESVFSGKPVFVLGDHSMARLDGVTALKQPDQLGAALAGMVTMTDSQACSLTAIQEVVRTSYPGYWFDPVTMGQFATEANLQALTEAFENVLAALAADPARRTILKSSLCAPTSI
ncbi:hypothetical protein HNP55_000914 [Paucibacter oligotrophus]|uniref:Capsular polysaccharide biosynthesis protein n=1 Tax=Roseateles oligotrophus TaxID=1769250 RepID=A0A840L8E9_9BURK|nr:hypothetical protein [Roseateles oligotrophus]MBB4842419.1 hypothetical protein [Roseateles oligotrophus]